MSHYFRKLSTIFDCALILIRKLLFAVHVNRMKPSIDPSLRPIDPPLFDDPSEPYLDESDIPDDSFEQYLSVDGNINSSPPILESKNSS